MWPGIEPRSPELLANTLIIRLMSQLNICMYKYMNIGNSWVKKIVPQMQVRIKLRGWYSFPWIAPLYPWYVPYIAAC